MSEKPEKMDVRNKPVECKVCHRKYICAPMDDYYESTTDKDGMCFGCLCDSQGVTGLPRRF